MEKYNFYLNQYKDQKDQIKKDMAERIRLMKDSEKLAQRVQKVVADFNGKVYNKRLDDALFKLEEEKNASIAAAGGANRVGIYAKRAQRSSDRQWVLEIRIDNRPQAYRYDNKVQYFITVDLTDYTNGRIKAETFRPEDNNASSLEDYQAAHDQADTAEQVLADTLKAIQAFNALPFYLRSQIQLPYIYSHKQ